MSKRMIIFHPAIAPYRVDFFNELYGWLGAKICLYRDHLKSQGFSTEDTSAKLKFKPDYFRHFSFVGHDFYIGHMKRLIAYRPDIVITGEYGLGTWCAVAYKILFDRKCCVYTICDDSYDIALSCKGARRISRDRIMKYMDGLILCSRNTAGYYRGEHMIDSYVFPIIPKAQSFYDNKEQAEKIANEYIKEYELIGKRVFLYIGRLSVEKNIEYLIRSFIKAHEKYPENRLFIIGGCNRGDTGYDTELKSLTTVLGGDECISFTGREEGIRLRAWQYLGQCLVLPSKYEPFGAVVGEALLAGEYVMVSDKAGSAELVDTTDNTMWNGCIIDTAKEKISFNEISEKIRVIGEEWKPSESRLRIDFENYMDGLKEWILKVQSR